MKLSFSEYQIPSISNERRGIHIMLKDAAGRQGIGDIAPLPDWSQETFEAALSQIHAKQKEIENIQWESFDYPEKLNQLELFPSVHFGLESALLSLLDPIPLEKTHCSGLFTGSLEQILHQAALRKEEGYKSAKLKVSQLSFDDAAKAINLLKDDFKLRIDVNRAWETSESLDFFYQFEPDTFDYVEEPFQDSRDLVYFPFPLAVDESFPSDLTLEGLEQLPQLKALIYKPTLQGGLSRCLPLKIWADKRGIQLVLSSCFESDIGIAAIADLAHRLKTQAPSGLGTYHFLHSYFLPKLNLT